MLRQPFAVAVVCLIAIVMRRPSAADPTLSIAEPLANAHAHNDYLHARPLYDALDHGFCSIEADVWLIDDELFVGHGKAEIRANRTLESLYLKPLAERCRQRGGWVYDRGRTVTLLVDFKSAGEQTFPVLKAQLAGYRKLLTASDREHAPIEVIVTGDRPVDLIRNDGDRLVAVDGRLADLGASESRELMPLVSESWATQFRWRGTGPMPEHERTRLRQQVAAAHANRQRLRYWGAPDNEAIWAELIAAEVDLLGADDLARLEKFLRRE
jgi:hypothetical protein